MTFPVEPLLAWYGEVKRDLPWRRTHDIYRIWVSEVMLQQTQVTTATPYYHRFLARFPGIADLAAAPEQDVLKLWEGLGYYSRARNFLKAARRVMEKHGGRVPEDPETFRQLPGVGPYITAAVLSIARNHRLPAVDGNVLRVYTRFRGIGDDIRLTAVRNRITTELQEIIPAQAGDFNQAMMELGATICTPKSPRCPQCPLSDHCTAHTTGTTAQYPHKSPPVKGPRYNVSIGIIVKNHRILIRKRPSHGHLGGLWEFPGGKAEGNETPEQTLLRECREEVGREVEIIKKLGRVSHAYSHFSIVMDVFICRWADDREGPINSCPHRPHCWIGVDQLDHYPFPGANHKFFPALRRFMSETNVKTSEF